MKKTIAIVIVVVMMAGGFSLAMPAMASPPIVPPPGSHFTFNCVTEGPVGANEILVPLTGSGMLGFTEGSSFLISDNDMTDGQAWVQVPAGVYDTYDQARGKPGGDLTWGNYHARVTGKPVWQQHNVALPIPGWGVGNWPFTNNGVTCYSFRLYPLP